MSGGFVIRDRHDNRDTTAFIEIRADNTRLSNCADLPPDWHQCWNWCSRKHATTMPVVVAMQVIAHIEWQAAAHAELVPA